MTNQNERALALQISQCDPGGMPGFEVPQTGYDSVRDARKLHGRSAARALLKTAGCRQRQAATK